MVHEFASTFASDTVEAKDGFTNLLWKTVTNFTHDSYKNNTSSNDGMVSPCVPDVDSVMTSVPPRLFKYAIKSAESLLKPDNAVTSVTCSYIEPQRATIHTDLSLMILMVFTPQAAANWITLCPTPLLDPF